MSELKRRRDLFVAWVRNDPERAMRMVVLPPIIVITFAVAASHTLEVGGTRAHVTGWKAWSVAGTLEILAAYSFFRFVQARRWRRVFPALVSTACAFMILWINLASITNYSWNAIKNDPWPAVFALTPAATFLLSAALIEVDGWRTTQRRRTARGGASTGRPARQDQTDRTGREKPAHGGPGLDEITLERARRGIAALQERGDRITGDNLRAEMGGRKATALRAMDRLGYGKKKKESA